MPQSALPTDAHLHGPKDIATHTAAQCDEVLGRGCTPEIADQWLDERLSAMRMNTARIIADRDPSQPSPAAPPEITQTGLPRSWRD